MLPIIFVFFDHGLPESFGNTIVTKHNISMNLSRVQHRYVGIFCLNLRIKSDIMPGPGEADQPAVDLLLEPFGPLCFRPDRAQTGSKLEHIHTLFQEQSHKLSKAIVWSALVQA